MKSKRITSILLVLLCCSLVLTGCKDTKEEEAAEAARVKAAAEAARTKAAAEEATPKKAASAEDSITVGTATTIIITRPDNHGDVWYAVKLPILNKTAHFLHVLVELQAVDKDGFEMDTVLLSETLQPSRSETLTDKTYMSDTQYKSIAKWQIKDVSQRVVDKPIVVVSDVATRLQTPPDNSGDIWYAIKANVENLSDIAFRGVELQAVDKDGYEIDSVTIRGNVKPGQRTTLSDKTFMQSSEFNRIARWRHVDR